MPEEIAMSNRCRDGYRSQSGDRIGGDWICGKSALCTFSPDQKKIADKEISTIITSTGPLGGDR
jgi:hypothetical protein